MSDEEMTIEPRREPKDQVHHLVKDTLGLVGYSSYRIDYLKLHIVADFDYYQTHVATEVRAVDAHLATLDGHAESRTTALGHLEGGRRGYIVEWYGEAAEYAITALPERMLSNVTRVDFRTTLVDVDDQGIDLLADYLRRSARGDRNLTQYDTRKRTKKNGRHAGGKGVALGSHKSQQRLTWYKRTGEPAALELQVQGQKSVQLVRDAITASTGQGLAVRSATIKNMLAASLVLKLREAGFDTFDDMYSFIVRQEPTARDLQEMSVASLATAFRRLPPSAQLDFLGQVFGRNE